MGVFDAIIKAMTPKAPPQIAQIDYAPDGSVPMPDQPRNWRDATTVASTGHSGPMIRPQVYETDIYKGLASGLTAARDAYRGTYDPMSEEGAGRALDMAGLAMTGGLAGAPAGALGSGPIRAYHGSPHNFKRFDMTKVGSGEGTQMEGHGLYFGQSPDVADFYYQSTVKDMIARQANAAQRMHPDQQRQMVDDIMGIVQREGPKALKDYDPPRGFEAAWDAAIGAAQKTKRSGKGTRYEVDIHADPNKLYDLDKPLNQQVPEVVDAINRVGRDPRFALDRIPDDAKRYDLNPLFKNPGAVAELNRHGIPGLKYWDQFSRKDGDGTKNLVIFDDKLVEILRKYGVASFAALPPAVQAAFQAEQPE